MSVYIRDRYTLKRDIMSYPSGPPYGSHNVSSYYVPGNEIDRVGQNSKLVDNWRQPNPFQARYYNYLAENQDTLGFQFQCYKHSLTQPNDPRYNFLRREGTWYEYPNNAILSQRLKGRHRDRIEMESIAISQSYNQLKDSPVHLGMFLSTLPETLRFIAVAYRTFTKALRYLRKGQVIKAGKELIAANKQFRPSDIKSMDRKLSKMKDTSKVDTDILDVISSKWLELQFAWGPLLQDVEGLIKIAPHLESASQMPRVTGRRVLLRQFADQSYTENVGSAPYGPGLTNSVSSTSETAVICRTDWTVGNPDLYMLSMLGLVNPLEVVWDKVPFSFVVDWFIPVGTWISAMTADAGLNYLGGSITSSSDCRIDVTSKPRQIVTNTDVYETIGQGSFSIREKDTQRGIFHSAPSLRLPPLRYPSTLWHAATGSALLYQTKDLITSNLKIR